MTQREFHRAIARVTGESLRTIDRLGFSRLENHEPHCETDGLETTPQIVDWDQLDADRIALAIQA
jgi:hypothetical protein